MESDKFVIYTGKHTFKFLSTLSAWRATVILYSFNTCIVISIHALRMESDDDSMPVEDVAADISIHALRMESDLDLRQTLVDRQ